ncbi:copper chaperone PCu(A)C [Vibrio sp. D404a]|uniref:copper chaperone PCu(A)C n=1 Tax=unclassified Vibrio TaxID=2614977 RepID=UPI0025527B48|nr:MULTISPECIES: copper chaperone PCu(A)C [unclassified Vibrio]MDK9736742.1 copper chaperone PCu(A)C [Vibrio sp. D404a]MDK9795840.1 copper chaperone PCu(A)C [Vibrio sp. D449a]
MKLKALALAGMLFSGVTQASDVMIHDAYARAMPPSAVNSAVFTTLMNHSDATRTLVSASTPAAGKVELHDVIMEGEVMKMRQVEHIQIPAHGSTELKPGSLHIMLFDLAAHLEEGQSITLTLNYANGDAQTVEVPVKKVMSGMKKMDHSHH